jgi:hypothetical protein
MSLNPVDTLKSVIEVNWNSSNTDSITPTFGAIYDYKKVDFFSNQDWILIHPEAPRSQRAAGVGVVTKNIEFNLKVDVRVYGEDQESHFRKVEAEVERILDHKIKLLDGTYDIIDSDTDWINLSDKTHKMWRILLPVKIKIYAKSR